MSRILVCLLSIVAMSVFAFDAVAQPCAARMEMTAAPMDMTMAEMPCHDGMVMPGAADQPEAPDHDNAACCCTPVLVTVAALGAVTLSQPAPGIASWADPLPDFASSVSFEKEPPPPRA